MDKNKPIAGLALRILQSAGEVISNPNENKLVAIVKFLFFVTAALLVIATEPLKLLMRKNIGEDAFERKSLMICCALYLIWAGVLYYLYINDTNAKYEASIYFSGIAFYGIMTFWLVYVWLFLHEKEQDKNDNHRGDSVFFAFLGKLGFSDNVICAFIEPLTCLIISAIITKLNLYIGIPILITSISFLANEIHEVYLVPQVQAETDKKIKKTFTNKIREELSDEKYNRVN